MIIYLSLLVCLAGLLMMALAEKAKLVTIGDRMFTCGLLAFLLLVERIVPLVH